MSKIIKFTKRNIDKITSGYYWLANNGFDKTGKDIILHRPVEIIVVKEAYTRHVQGFRDGIWTTPGVYVVMIGNDMWSHITGILEWGNVVLTPAKPPKGF